MAIGIILTFVILIVVGVVFWGIYQLYKPSEQPRDDTLVDFYCPHFTRGYSQGILKEIIYGTKRVGIVFYPKDRDRMKLQKGEEKTKPETIRYWVEENKLKWAPRGSWSRRRNRLIVLPPRVEFTPKIVSDMVGNLVTEKNAEQLRTKLHENEAKSARGFLEKDTSWKTQKKEVEKLKDFWESSIKSSKGEKSTSADNTSSPKL